jgi:hypothetical protein
MFSGTSPCHNNPLAFRQDRSEQSSKECQFQGIKVQRFLHMALGHPRPSQQSKLCLRIYDAGKAPTAHQKVQYTYYLNNELLQRKSTKARMEGASSPSRSACVQVCLVSINIWATNGSREFISNSGMNGVDGGVKIRQGFLLRQCEVRWAIHIAA